MRELRTLNIIDEIEERIKQQTQIDQVESQRDKTYEEFLGTYLDHIEGRVEHDERHAHRPVTAEGADSNVGDPRNKVV